MCIEFQNSALEKDMRMYFQWDSKQAQMQHALVHTCVRIMLASVVMFVVAMQWRLEINQTCLKTPAITPAPHIRSKDVPKVCNKRTVGWQKSREKKEAEIENMAHKPKVWHTNPDFHTMSTSVQ